MVFTRNQLCALTSDRVNATPDSLLATLLDPQVRVGTSTPKADPSGDYAWQLFRRADRDKQCDSDLFRVLQSRDRKSTRLNSSH